MIRSFSIIIPCYNEAETIRTVLDELLVTLPSQGWDAEIIVVNDGSTDATKQILAEYGERITIIEHPYNKGYGAAIMSGIRSAKKEWILTYDCDGQHEPIQIEKLLEHMHLYDMVVGARTTGYKGPLWRQPGKWLLHRVAEYLVKRPIPDLNSGLRLAKRDLIMRYFHLFPQGFSLSTTATLAFLKDGLNVAFCPITLRPRIGGKSSVTVNDGMRTIMFMVRIIMVFSPLRVFLPASTFLSIVGFSSLIVDLKNGNLGDTTVLLLTTGLLIFFFGLLADQVAAVRRQMK